MQGIDNIALNFTNKTSDELQAQRVQREEEPSCGGDSISKCPTSS